MLISRRQAKKLLRDLTGLTYATCETEVLALPFYMDGAQKKVYEELVRNRAHFILREAEKAPKVRHGLLSERNRMRAGAAGA